MRYGGRGAFALFLSAALFVFSGCGETPSEKAKAPLVRTQRIAAGETVRTVNYAGSVRGRYEKAVASSRVRSMSAIT